MKCWRNSAGLVQIIAPNICQFICCTFQSGANFSPRRSRTQRQKSTEHNNSSVLGEGGSERSSFSGPNQLCWCNCCSPTVKKLAVFITWCNINHVGGNKAQPLRHTHTHTQFNFCVFLVCLSLHVFHSQFKMITPADNPTI